MSSKPGHQRRGRAGRSMSDTSGGRYTRAVARKPLRAKISLDATARAFASAIADRSQPEVAEENHFMRVPLSALRYKVFRRKRGTLFIFAVDASGSMAVNRIRQAKGAIAQLLQ